MNSSLILDQFVFGLGTETAFPSAGAREGAGTGAGCDTVALEVSAETDEVSAPRTGSASTAAAMMADARNMV